ncbi:MAG: hypothetical protein A2Z34_10765 [Planctomycetes bacterium RBG_16_59_8]|nr:MAG: hypothetical protein A2Z34_10765 [Planctomycetes bacterium RBG_16_59_8]
MPTLVIRLEGEGEKKVALTASRATLGRGIECEIRINDVRMSRRHCQIVRTPQGYILLDLGSGNGTKVNGVKIKQQKLSSGDQFQIGGATVLFTDVEPPAVPPLPMVQPLSPDEIRQADLPTQVLPRMSEHRPSPGAVKKSPPPEPADPVVAPSPDAPDPQPRTSSLRPPTTGRKSPSLTNRTPLAPGKSATSKFVAASRSRFPTLWVLCGAGALAVIIVLILLFTRGPSLGKIMTVVEKLRTDAVNAEKVGEYAEAGKIYREAVKTLEPRADDPEARREIKSLRAALETTEGKERLDTEAKKVAEEIAEERKKIEVKPENLSKMEALVEKVGVFCGKFREITMGATFERMKKELDLDRQKMRVQPIGERYAAMQQQMKEYLQAKKKEYRMAIRAARKFIEENPGTEQAESARQDVKGLNANALAELERLGEEAEAKAKTDTDVALSFLESEEERFQETDAAPRLKELMDRIEQGRKPR